MTDWLEHEWRIAGGLTGVLALLLSAVRLLRSSSVARPPFWRRVFQAGSAIIRLQIADGEIDYLKKALSDARLDRDWERSERIRIQNELRDLRKSPMAGNGESGRGSSAGSTSRGGGSTRKKRTTSGTSDKSTQ